MKNILYFILTFILFSKSALSCAQDSLEYDFTSPEFILKEPILKFDQSIELRALRNAYYIVIDDNNLRFYTENYNDSEEYEIVFRTLSVDEKVSLVRYDINYGPFRRLLIEYREAAKGNYSSTLKFFNISGKMIYSAHADQLTNYEEIVLEEEFNDVK